VSIERELCRLAQLLIERVVIADGGLEIIWHDHGWRNWQENCCRAPAPHHCR